MNSRTFRNCYTDGFKQMPVPRKRKEEFDESDECDAGELFVVKNPSDPPIEEREGWSASRNSRNSKAPT